MAWKPVMDGLPFTQVIRVAHDWVGCGNISTHRNLKKKKLSCMLIGVTLPPTVAVTHE